MARTRQLPFDRVLVVDDDAGARQGCGYTLEDMGVAPVYQVRPIPKVLGKFISRIPARAEAVFSDYRLTVRPDYASHNGDVLVATCVRRSIPAVLCTTYTDVSAHMNRVLLRYIPSLLRTNAPEPLELVGAFNYCCKEIRGEYHTNRRPWRTLVRINDVDLIAKECHVIVPARSASEKIPISLDHVPPRIRSLIHPGVRLHAEVNIGADNPNEVYFSKWEIK